MADNKLQLSKRLSAVASFITPGNRVVDVGTDHGYIPIFALQNQIAPSAIAMDVNKGPIKRAQDNINAYDLGSYIDTRLSDGLLALQKGEGDTLIIAGMGGNLTIRILEDGREVLASFQEIILEPQSDIQRVRHYIRTHGMKIVDEDMVLEDGKFYPVLHIKFEDENLMSDDFQLEDWYGPCLLKKNHPVLGTFLERESNQINDILCKLNKSKDSESKELRIKELQEKQQRNTQAKAISMQKK